MEVIFAKPSKFGLIPVYLVPIITCFILSMIVYGIILEPSIIETQKIVICIGILIGLLIFLYIYFKVWLRKPDLNEKNINKKIRYDKNAIYFDKSVVVGWILHKISIDNRQRTTFIKEKITDKVRWDECEGYILGIRNGMPFVTSRAVKYGNCIIHILPSMCELKTLNSKLEISRGNIKATAQLIPKKNELEIYLNCSGNCREVSIYLTNDLKCKKKILTAKPGESKCIKIVFPRITENTLVITQWFFSQIFEGHYVVNRLIEKFGKKEYPYLFGDLEKLVTYELDYVNPYFPIIQLTVDIPLKPDVKKNTLIWYKKKPS